MFRFRSVHAAESAGQEIAQYRHLARYLSTCRDADLAHFASVIGIVEERGHEGPLERHPLFAERARGEPIFILALADADRMRAAGELPALRGALRRL